MNSLFSPINIGQLCLPNRIFMAPLTRLRSIEPGDLPTPLMGTYYSQRATAGLIITEGTQISPEGKGYSGAPGIYTPRQVDAWRRITDDIHAKGGHVAMQLWHVGRISHSCLQPDHRCPVAPSPIMAKARTTVRNETGEWVRVPCSPPRALQSYEIPELIDSYRQAARYAKEANVDMIELHAAHGYLLHQFLSPQSNQREDQYGGCLDNRARLLFEVVDTLCEIWHPSRIGVRLSPIGSFHDINSDEQAEEETLFLVKRLNTLQIGYLHLSEPDWIGGPPFSDTFRLAVREHYKGCIVGAGAYTLEKANHFLRLGVIDAVAFGRPFIANPDLVERLRHQAPLNPAHPETFYGGGAEGYTDYPTLYSS